MHGVSVAVFVALVACACALPITQSPWELISGKFEGDILLHPSQIGKNGILDKTKYWPGAIMYFSINSTFTASQRTSILNAANEYNTRTCVRLVERTNQNNYVAIGGSQSGCYSAAGMQGGNPNATIGQRVGLSAKDIQKLHAMYGCRSA